MRRSKSRLILVFLSVLLFTLFLISKLLECHNIFRLLLENEPIDFFFYLNFNLSFVYLNHLQTVYTTVRRIFLIVVPSLLILLLLVFFHAFDLIEYHKAEGECIQDIKELVGVEVVVSGQL